MRDRAQGRNPGRAWIADSIRSPVRHGAQMTGSAGRKVAYGSQAEQMIESPARAAPHGGLARQIFSRCLNRPQDVALVAAILVEGRRAA